MSDARRAHWDRMYASRPEGNFGWTEHAPEASLALIGTLELPFDTAVIDIGSGLSALPLALLAAGLGDVTCLDISGEAVARAKAQLGHAGDAVTWIAADVTEWHPARSYDLWHDRAVFHFLTTPEGRKAYIDRLAMALEPGAHAVIASFAADGPQTCARLPVQRYSPALLAQTLGPRFALVQSLRHVHMTPGGEAQPYQYSLFRRN
ncbi:class I SAM-dependent methyltransferase [Tropicibacter naphthalenivorans]|uniref:Trans-aconitate methyltransferase n=1 Tax=Tropicibacter naphthalenivorans TaxID=441103 RepID=A0A0N7M0C1_9RHOB|nr:class I SAM-dependent methyltransferase [Tropicibacter naphthalenivorans]CUH80049.1 Trans-aconitate methyltransferase [Tropicibacter naphthalenivorans]SMC84076.1 Methyltransferase domain-containing protein [Tropicibacter naphthalenivorans]